MAKDKKLDDATKSDDGLYRAPRLSSMPYPSSGSDNAKEKEKRLKKRMRASELAQTLREQYGEAPEQEDMHGGTDYGKQREAARRVAEHQAEKTRYEEENMIRLTTTRKEKKEFRRIMRDEASNLGAISDIGNLARGVSDAFDSNHGDDDDDDNAMESQMMGGGKRRRNDDGRKSRKGKKGIKATNSLQKELWAGGGQSSGGGKKKGKKRR